MGGGTPFKQNSPGRLVSFRPTTGAFEDTYYGMEWKRIRQAMCHVRIVTSQGKKEKFLPTKQDLDTT